MGGADDDVNVGSVSVQHQRQDAARCMIKNTRQRPYANVLHESVLTLYIKKEYSACLISKQTPWGKTLSFIYVMFL